MLRFLTAGESHGKALVVIVEGLPAGLPVTVDDVPAQLGQLGATVLSHVVELGPVVAKVSERPRVEDLARIDASEVRCADPDAEAAMIEAIKAASKDGDSLGGAAEIVAHGVPVGLGSHV